MGKKTKKEKDGSAKGKKKKGGKKGKKGGDPPMTWKEALLAYQINIKEKQMEDIRYELRALEEKNMRHKERNERLRGEQQLHIKNMLRQAEEVEKKLAEEEVVDKSQVIKAMMENWEAERREEKNIADLKEQIARKEAEIVKEKKQVSYWKQYEAKGQHEHSKQIMLLQQELVDMENTFEEMAAHIKRSLDQAKQEISEKTDKTLEKQKFIATEKALAKLDKYGRQEVIDNEWLHKEVVMHNEEVDKLLKEVEQLEKENLEIMSELFECQVEDLKISRNVFLTQFADGENLEENGILEIDLAKLDMDSYRSKPETNRPKSAIHKAVEDKVRSVVVYNKEKGKQEDEDEDENEEELVECDFDGKIERDSDEEDPFYNFYQFDDEDFDDYLKLGPLELKLLNISGHQIPVHTQGSPSLDDGTTGALRQSKWPVTGAMLHNTLKLSARK